MNFPAPADGSASMTEKTGVYELPANGLGRERLWGAGARLDSGVFFRLGEHRDVEETETTLAGPVYFPHFLSREAAQAALERHIAAQSEKARVSSSSSSSSSAAAAASGSNNIFQAMDGAFAIVQDTGPVMIARKGRDGRISRLEFDTFWEHMAHTQPSSGLWHSEDANGDGFLSWDEFSGPKGDRPAAATQTEE